VIDALDLADAAGAGMERRQFRLPARGVGRDLDDAVVDDMRVDHAAPAAIVAAGAGHHRLVCPSGTARLLVDRLVRHHSHLAKADRVNPAVRGLHRFRPLANDQTSMENEWNQINAPTT